MTDMDDKDNKQAGADKPAATVIRPRNPSAAGSGSPADNATVIKTPGAAEAAEAAEATVIKTPQREQPAPATMIKPQQTSQPPAQTLGEHPAVTEILTHPSAILDTNKKLRALTQIGRSLKSMDSSTGFDKARLEVNKALANNKIILNRRFVLDKIIGTGGMGTVYKARDLRKVEANDSNPNVAIKVLNEAFQNHPDAFKTLQREASKSNVLGHPNIVSVHDFDRDGPICYMTMELLEGQDLERLIKHNQQGLEVDKALDIITGFCSALSYAHQKDIIHSDLKPGNLYVTEDGIKVLDFGIARLGNDAQQHDSFDVGSLGALTPTYASLEMLRYEAPDQSDDVYAAALIAYELFSGKHPYDRMPADKALEAGLKPKRIDKLNKHQWAALEAALKLERSARTPTIDQFIHELTYVKRYALLATALVLIAALVGVFAYYEFYAQPDLSEQVAHMLGKGEDCFQNKDFQCSIDNANAILEIEPKNTSAKALLDKAHATRLTLQEQNLVAEANNCIKENDFDCARVKLAGLEELLSTSKHIPILKKSIEIKILSNEIQQCMDDQQYQCVVDTATKLLETEPSNQFAQNLRDKAQDKIDNRNHAAAENARKYRNYLAKADNCFSKKQYDCAIKYARLALQHKRNDPQAERIQQEATFAQRRREETYSKAKILVQQGRQELTKGRFNNAIAKAESALELVSGYKPAIKLKQDAKRKQDLLKKGLSISGETILGDKPAKDTDTSPVNDEDEF